jgi:hypothetical protein
LQVKYNESLCKTHSGSETMSLSYANRSAVYFQLKLYEKCLENIALALENNYPEEKKIKLIERKRACEKGVQKENKIKQEEASKYELKLTKPANRRIPFIAKCLELRNNSKFGNHIVTTETLYPGDVISNEDFFSYIVTRRLLKTTDSPAIDDDKVYFQVCACCLDSNLLSLLPCAGCGYTMYCSQKCQTRAHGYHQYECDIFDKLIDTPFGSVRFLCRALSICNHDIEELKQLIEVYTQQLNKGSPPLTVFDLDYSTMSKDEILKKSILVAYGGARSEKCIEGTQFVLKLLLNESSRLAPMMTHSHSDFIMDFIGHMDLVQTIYEHNFDKITHKKDQSEIFCGESQSLFHGLLNHSCAPNVYRLRNGERGFVLVVNQVIEAGQQIFDCYINGYINVPKFERQTLLQHYGFTCDCNACKFDYPLVDQLNVVFDCESAKMTRFENARVEELQLTQQLHPDFVRHLLNKWFTQLKLLAQTKKKNTYLDICVDVVLLRVAFCNLLRNCIDCHTKID